MIEGLRVSGDQLLMQTAERVATNWLRASYRAYISSGHNMFEKYNVSNAATDESAAGGGGEYEVQVRLNRFDLIGRPASAGRTASCSTCCTSTARTSCSPTTLPRHTGSRTNCCCVALFSCCS